MDGQTDGRMDGCGNSISKVAPTRLTAMTVMGTRGYNVTSSVCGYVLRRISRARDDFLTVHTGTAQGPSETSSSSLKEEFRWGFGLVQFQCE
jgi:hypothetical protein